MKKSRGVMTTFLPTLMKVLIEVSDFLAAASGSFTLRELTRAKPAPDSLSLNIEFAPDCLLRISFVM
jgi:hypothetical protein